MFVVLTVSAHLAVIGVAFLMPRKSDELLERASTWLTVHNRVLMIVLGAVFGTWLLIKALDGFGVI